MKNKSYSVKHYTVLYFARLLDQFARGFPKNNRNFHEKRDRPQQEGLLSVVVFTLKSCVNKVFLPF